MPDDVSSLGDEKFVSLTTFKKSGEKSSTAMWLARRRTPRRRRSDEAIAWVR